MRTMNEKETRNFPVYASHWEPATLLDYLSTQLSVTVGSFILLSNDKKLSVSYIKSVYFLTITVVGQYCRFPVVLYPDGY